MSRRRNARKRQSARAKRSAQEIGSGHGNHGTGSSSRKNRGDDGDDRRRDPTAADASRGREVGVRGGSVARSGDGDPAVGPPGQQGELFQVEQTLVHRSGPLPDPEELAAYQALDPGLVDRIVRMAEVSVTGRYAVQRRAVTAESLAVVIGAVTMALVAVGGIGASIVLLAQGYETTSLFTAIPAVLIGVGQILTAARRRGEG